MEDNDSPVSYLLSPFMLIQARPTSVKKPAWWDRI